MALKITQRNGAIRFYFMTYFRDHMSIIIRLEARLQPNIGFTLRRVLAVFTRLSITPPKVN